jgi:hypothetical protein
MCLGGKVLAPVFPADDVLIDEIMTRIFWKELC